MGLPSIIQKLRSFIRSKSLGGKVLSGSLWTMAGYGGQQVLRFGNNVVMAWLLFPEAFGLMVLVNTVILGLSMFSDVGVSVSLIQSKRGKEEAFLRTAFSVQAIRGFFLWMLAAALAYPMSRFFQEPQLSDLLPVAALTSILTGFRSTKWTLASRDIALGRITQLKLGAQVVGIIVMIGWAAVWPTVWALVAGTLVDSTLQVLGSHLLLPGKRDKFGWDKSAWDELFTFGRWIFVSTALAYLSGRGDALLMGRMLTAAQLGIFGIASNLARLVEEVSARLSNTVLLPAYAEVNREDPERLHKILFKSRATLIAVGAAAALPLLILGDMMIDLVYDPRYRDAGWMLQTLACGLLSTLPQFAYRGVLHSKGMSFEYTVLQFFEVSIKFVCFALGFYFYGLPGLIVGVAFNAWVSYPILAIMMRKARVWQPKLDLLTLAFAGVVTVLFLMFRPAGLELERREDPGFVAPTHESASGDAVVEDKTSPPGP